MQKAVSGIAAALALFVLGLGGWVAIEAESFADLAEQGVKVLTDIARYCEGVASYGTATPSRSLTAEQGHRDEKDPIARASPWGPFSSRRIHPPRTTPPRMQERLECSHRARR